MARNKDLQLKKLSDVVKVAKNDLKKAEIKLKKYKKQKAKDKKSVKVKSTKTAKKAKM